MISRMNNTLLIDLLELTQHSLLPTIKLDNSYVLCTLLENSLAFGCKEMCLTIITKIIAQFN